MNQPFIMRMKIACLITFAALALAMPGHAQGIDTKSGAVVFSGSSLNCTAPATIDYRKVRNTTPEWKTIRSDGVRKGSARYTLLLNKMDRRIKECCRAVARTEGKDCIVRKGDISDAKGLKVVDVTREVVKKLESR